MRRWLAIIIIFISISAVLAGRFSYEAKLTEIAEAAKLDREFHLKEQSQHKEEEKIQDEETASESINELTQGLDPAISALIESHYLTNETMQVAAFGSRALVDSEDEGIIPWPVLLEELLNEGYDNDFFEIQTYSYERLTSLEVIEQGFHDEVASFKPDLLILEPFMLANNGVVSVNDSLVSMELIIDAFERENEDIIILIQPPQPMYGSFYYPQQVEDLKNYVLENDMFYVDHWEAWPDIEDDELLNFTSADYYVPTQEGHKLWAEALRKYFIR